MAPLVKESFSSHPTLSKTKVLRQVREPLQLFWMTLSWKLE